MPPRPANLRISRRAAVSRPERMTRELITPEGVDLRLNLGDASQRASAFVIDAAIMVGVLIAFSLVCLVIVAIWPALDGLDIVGAVWLLGFFLLRNFYFVAFEAGARGATPGKRAVGLRVASRDVGRLTMDAVFARNAMRELEVYLPLTFLVLDAKGLDAWVVLAGTVWCGLFVFFPLFNADRMRAGDLVAGTWVVRTPTRRLLRDLSEDRALAVRFDFTRAQLDAYGIKELQVLEGLLRRKRLKSLAEVASRIRGKIGWEASASESDWEFLEAYYAALRGRLETQLLFGRRRADKHDTA